MHHVYRNANNQLDLVLRLAICFTSPVPTTSSNPNVLILVS